MKSDPSPATFETGDPIGQWDSAPADWQQKKLWDLADYLNGRAFKPTDFSPEGLRVIKITELKYGISADTSLYNGPFDARHFIQDDELLFAWSGNPETSLDAFRWRDGEAILNQHIFRVIPRNGIDQTYLFFLLKFLRPTFIRTARDKATSMGHVKVSDLKRLIAYVPQVPEQRAIAFVLGAIDDRIELNRKMNQTLEQLTQAHFKNWSVDADANLPKSWRAGTLGEVAENPRRSIQPDEIKSSMSYIGLEHMPRRSIALSEWESDTKLGSNKLEFKCGEILFGKLRPYFHKVGVAPLDGVCSTDILVVRPKSPEWFGFVLGHVSSVELVNHTNAASTGTKMPRASWNDIARFEVALPPESVAAEFTDLIRPMIDRIIANIHESRTLAELRDALLPKLLSGELRVPNNQR
jgi:type I restriction enzyme, S subunit